MFKAGQLIRFKEWIVTEGLFKNINFDNNIGIIIRIATNKDKLKHALSSRDYIYCLFNDILEFNAIEFLELVKENE